MPSLGETYPDGGFQTNNLLRIYYGEQNLYSSYQTRRLEIVVS
jgi:hypothetical protein